MSVESETQLEAFIAANIGGGKLKKITLTELTFNDFGNYLSVYHKAFKNRTAFIDNVFVALTDDAGGSYHVLSLYDDDREAFRFEYSSMASGNTDNLLYVAADTSKDTPNYLVVYSQGAFLDAEARALLRVGSKISCDIYVLE